MSLSVEYVCFFMVSHGSAAVDLRVFVGLKLQAISDGS